MLNQGRPLLRVERSGARKGKGDSREWGAPGPGVWGSEGRVGRLVGLLCGWAFLLMDAGPVARVHCLDGE